MKNDLLKKTEEWMQLERKTMEQRKLAQDFYDLNLMNLISEDYIMRNQEKIYEQVEYLVATVGTSYEPVVLNITNNPCNRF